VDPRLLRVRVHSICLRLHAGHVDRLPLILRVRVHMSALGFAIYYGLRCMYRNCASQLRRHLFTGAKARAAEDCSILQRPDDTASMSEEVVEERGGAGPCKIARLARLLDMDNCVAPSRPERERERDSDRERAHNKAAAEAQANSAATDFTRNLDFLIAYQAAENRRGARAIHTLAQTDKKKALMDGPLPGCYRVGDRSGSVSFVCVCVSVYVCVCVMTDTCIFILAVLSRISAIRVCIHC
jgi:hypothetical protein